MKDSPYFSHTERIKRLGNPLLTNSSVIENQLPLSSHLTSIIKTKIIDLDREPRPGQLCLEAFGANTLGK